MPLIRFDLVRSRNSGEGEALAKRGKRVTRKSPAKPGKPVRRRAAKRAAVKANTLAKKKGKKLSARMSHSPITKTRKKKQNSAPTLEPSIETAITDMIQQPVPGVVSEIEGTRATLPDSGKVGDEQRERPAA